MSLLRHFTSMLSLPFWMLSLMLRVVLRVFTTKGKGGINWNLYMYVCKHI